MNFQAKHSKILKGISSASLENFLECVSSVEYTLQTCNPDLQKAIVPLEANFQIPNILLKTKKCFKVENLFAEKNLSADWNDRLDYAICFIDNIELECEEESQDLELDIKLLENLIRWRFSAQSS